MKDRFVVRFSAAVLVFGVYCSCSPYLCVIHAGYADETVWIADATAPMADTDSMVFHMDADTRRTEDIREAARACVEALGNPEALVEGRKCRDMLSHGKRNGLLYLFLESGLRGLVRR